jgi:integrase
MNATFREFVEDEYLPHSQAVNTKRCYETQTTRANGLYPFFGDKRLRDIRRADIEKFRDQRIKSICKRTKRPFRPATVNREIMLLSAVFREAFLREYVDRNPVRGVKPLAELNRRVRYLSPDEEKKLLSACALHLRPIVVTAIHSGMRRGELLGLLWGDIDFDQRLVRVRAETSKTHKQRYIPMNDTLHATLKEIAPDDDRWGADRPVFAHSDGTKKRQTVGTGFEGACKRAVIVDFHFHDLRHTFASRLVQAGVPLNRVAELLGHADLKMTLRYAHLAPANLVDAVKTLDPDVTKVEPTPNEQRRKVAH